jgi:hypothetical protein
MLSIACDDEVPGNHLEDVALRAPVRGCEFGVVGDKPERDVVETNWNRADRSGLRDRRHTGPADRFDWGI